MIIIIAKSVHLEKKVKYLNLFCQDKKKSYHDLFTIFIDINIKTLLFSINSHKLKVISNRYPLFLFNLSSENN
jgi:hypothetical protein